MHPRLNKHANTQTFVVSASSSRTFRPACGHQQRSFELSKLLFFLNESKTSSNAVLLRLGEWFNQDLSFILPEACLLVGHAAGIIISSRAEAHEARSICETARTYADRQRRDNPQRTVSMPSLVNSNHLDHKLEAVWQLVQSCSSRKLGVFVFTTFAGLPLWRLLKL